jgi:hypothetical protein
MIRLKCVIPGKIIFTGKNNKTYEFTDGIPVEVEEIDVPTMLGLIFVSGGCCGAPKIPYFQLIE